MGENTSSSRMISREVGGVRMEKDRPGSRRRVLVCEQQGHFKDIKFPSPEASIGGPRCSEASTTIKVQIMKWFFS